MKRLSLEAFKAKAENVNTSDVLEKVQGGDWSDCHGCDGTWAKIKDYLGSCLEKGEIIEEGDHQKLVNNKGVYYKLVKDQLELGS